MSYAQLTGRDSLRDIENCLMALSMEYEAITISELYRERWNVERFLTDKTHLNELFNKAVPKEEPEDLWYPSLFKLDDF